MYAQGAGPRSSEDRTQIPNPGPASPATKSTAPRTPRMTASQQHFHHDLISLTYADRKEAARIWILFLGLPISKSRNN